MTIAIRLAKQITDLKPLFEKIERVDPNGTFARGLRQKIAAIENNDALRIIHGAGIKWVSTLALTQLIIRGEPI